MPRKSSTVRRGSVTVFLVSVAVAITLGCRSDSATRREDPAPGDAAAEPKSASGESAASSPKEPAASNSKGSALSLSKGAVVERGRVLVPGGGAFDVEIVQDPVSRERGLKNRTRIGPGEGMVFLFPAPGRQRFWMYECLIPLDIIWIDAGRTVIHVEESLPICSQQPCPDYGPESDAFYVLELGAGVARQAGIRPGMRLTLLFDHPPNPR